MNILSKLKNMIFRSKKSKIIAALVLVLVISASAGLYARAKNASVKSVTSVTVTKGVLTQSVTITGNIEANERNEISLSPAAKVVQVLAKEGQSVKKGDVLVKLDDTDYKTQLEKQKINLAAAAATIGGSSSTVVQAETALVNAKSNYEDANKKYQQSKVLFDNGYLSKNDLDAAQKAVSDSSNAVTNAEAALSNAKTSQNSQVALIQADIRDLNSKIDQCLLKANVDGVVTRLDAVEGQYPSTGDMIIVDETSSYAVGLKVSQYDSIKVKQGQKAKIKLKGVDKEYNGIVTKIGQLAEKTLTSSDQDAKVDIKVSITDPDENIKVGYEADADIILDEKQNALQVSFEAVQDEKTTGKKFVYVIGSNNKVQKKYVETGLETDYNIEVKSGLKEGDKCVSNPDKTLVEGDTVKEAGGTK